jgi:hypothetical protein
MNTNPTPRKAHHALTMTVPAVPHNAYDATETEIGANSGAEAIGLWMRYASEYNGPAARLTPEQARTLAADLTARADEIEPPSIEAYALATGAPDAQGVKGATTALRIAVDMEVLHERGRAYARSAAGDAFDGIPSLIELDGVLSMLTDAYVSGWSERDTLAEKGLALRTPLAEAYARYDREGGDENTADVLAAAVRETLAATPEQIAERIVSSSNWILSQDADEARDIAIAAVRIARGEESGPTVAYVENLALEAAEDYSREGSLSEQDVSKWAADFARRVIAGEVSL